MIDKSIIGKAQHIASSDDVQEEVLTCRQAFDLLFVGVFVYDVNEV